MIDWDATEKFVVAIIAPKKTCLPINKYFKTHS